MKHVAGYHSSGIQFTFETDWTERDGVVAMNNWWGKMEEWRSVMEQKMKAFSMYLKLGSDEILFKT